MYVRKAVLSKALRQVCALQWRPLRQAVVNTTASRYGNWTQFPARSVHAHLVFRTRLVLSTTNNQRKQRLAHHGPHVIQRVIMHVLVKHSRLAAAAAAAAGSTCLLPPCLTGPDQLLNVIQQLLPGLDATRQPAGAGKGGTSRGGEGGRAAGQTEG